MHRRQTDRFSCGGKILAGKKTVVDTFIVPATTDITRGLNETKIGGKSLKAIFEEAGCRIGNASCGACLGGPDDTFGRLNGVEVCISTTNRNFPGRMGSKKAQVFLSLAFDGRSFGSHRKNHRPEKIYLTAISG